MYEQASKKKYQSQNVVSSKIRDSEPTLAIIYEKNQHKQVPFGTEMSF